MPVGKFYFGSSRLPALREAGVRCPIVIVFEAGEKMRLHRIFSPASVKSNLRWPRDGWRALVLSVSKYVEPSRGHFDLLGK